MLANFIDSSFAKSYLYISVVCDCSLERTIRTDLP